MDRPPGSSTVITAVVCTFNRASILRHCLDSLGTQNADKAMYEVLIVDNGSTDDTEKVAAEFVRSYPNFRFVTESKVGLSHARNLGFRCAAGDYVAYFDDDCKIPPEWITTGLEIIRTKKPAAFGGPYFPFYLTDKPKWFKDEYAAWVLPEETRSLQSGEYLTGLNMAIEKRFLDKLGGFDPALGMMGNKMAYGEETEFFQRLRVHAPETEIYYDRRLYVHHLVRQNKMTMLWRMRHHLTHGYYWGQCTIDPAILQKSNSWKEPFRNLKGLAKDSLKGLLWRDRRSYPYYQNYLLEQTSHYLYSLGIWFGKRHSLSEKSEPKTTG